MRFLRSISPAVLIFAAVCGGSTEPQAGDCSATTVAVTASVTAGAQPVFSWAPACAVALVLVEENASDRWAVSTDESTWSNPDQANKIIPPVTYGQIPSGSQQSEAPIALVAGHTYDLVLWRAMTSATVGQCPTRFQNMCVVAVKQFVR